MELTGTLEQFMGGPTPTPNTRLGVTLNRNSMFRFNRAAYRAIGKAPLANLYYSREDSVIAIEPLHSIRPPTAFPILEHSAGWRICALSFCKHYGIRVDGTRRFLNPELSPDGRRLLLKLTETEEVFQIRANTRRRK